MRRIMIIIGVSLILICLSGLLSRQAVKINQVPKDLLRLHIIANSNSLTDQHIKRQVRQAVLTSSRGLFTGVTNISQAEQKINANLPYLTQVVQQRLSELGVGYKAELDLQRTKFPRRSYGSLTLSAGKYQALNIKLGRAAGENWWCVLFPPLCLVNSQGKQIKQEELPTSLKQAARKVRQPPVKFKFKLVEYIKKHPEFAKLKGKLGSIFWAGSN